MKNKSVLFAENIENLFFPDKVIISGGTLAILSVTNSNLTFNNFATFLISLLVFHSTKKLLGKRINNEDKTYLSSSILATVIFFILSTVLQVSDVIKFGALSLFLNLILLFVIRDFWKISAHVSVYVNACTVLTLINKSFLILFAFLPLVIWSRIKLKRHTYLQIVAGGFAGFLLSIIIKFLVEYI